MAQEAWTLSLSRTAQYEKKSDNGKEYTLHQFNSFCDEAGIEHQLTTLYTLKQKGVSEEKIDLLWR